MMSEMTVRRLLLLLTVWTALFAASQLTIAEWCYKCTSTVIVQGAVHQRLAPEALIPKQCDLFHNLKDYLVCDMMYNLPKLEDTMTNIESSIRRMQTETAKIKELEETVDRVEKDVATLKTDIHPTVKDCPPGFTHDASVKRCYRLVNYKLPWSSAAFNCHSLHPKAHLVSIENAAEQTAVTKFVKAKADKTCTEMWFPKQSQCFWTAGQWVDPDLRLASGDLSAKFVWRPSTPNHWLETPTPMKYTHWKAHEPDNYGGQQACIQLVGTEGWDDFDCAAALCSVCELGKD